MVAHHKNLEKYIETDNKYKVAIDAPQGKIINESRLTKMNEKSTTYKQAGVDIKAGDELVNAIKPAVKETNEKVVWEESEDSVGCSTSKKPGITTHCSSALLTESGLN